LLAPFVITLALLLDCEKEDEVFENFLEDRKDFEVPKIKNRREKVKFCY